MDIQPPPSVLAALDRLWMAGHAAYVVGGSLRDILLAREPLDWDLASNARPDRLAELFPGAVYENRFGTVAVRVDGDLLEITTFRTDHEYADFRRPHRVEFGDSIEHDLARRDFTVNAMAWGTSPTTGPDSGSGDRPSAPELLDPHGGLADLEARLLRAVGDPRVRFEEDALRMIRAARLAATLAFEVEAGTLAAMQVRSGLVAHLSGERLGAELGKLLDADQPSIGLRLMADTGILAVVSPELAAQRGIPQAKVPGDDLWAHTLRTVDAVPRGRATIRLAALLHDIGKPSTMADGHFYGHDAVGADVAAAFLHKIRAARVVVDEVIRLVRHHMFTYDPSWGDAGVRRFIRRIGRDNLDGLFELREADNVGSGEARDAHGLGELRQRVAEQLGRHAVLERADLAVNGEDLIAELGLAEGPTLGRILDELVERAIADPEVNDRATLLLLAGALTTDVG